MPGPDRIVLYDHHVGPQIIDYISNAKREIIIVCPYVKLWGHIENALERAKHRGVDRILYLRKEDNPKYDHAILERYFDTIIPIKNLHAKLYFFDDEIIMISMNLYDFSQSSSREIAIRLVDPGQKEEVRAYLRDQLAPPEPAKLSKGKRTASKVSGFQKDVKENASLEAPGNCIRCRREIDYDPERPYCPSCYRRWNKFANPTFEENYCHSCGKEINTSMLKPLCMDCYKKEFT